VAIGFLFVFIMLWAAYLWRRGRLFKTAVPLDPGLDPALGFVATELGWITTEMGRQPWLVYNLMRVSEGISPIPAGNVLWSLALFLVIFPMILISYFYYVFKTLRGGPDLKTPIRPSSGRPECWRLEEEAGKRGEIMDLVLVWAALVALAMILYILLDGISLGVGLLFRPERMSRKEIS